MNKNTKTIIKKIALSLIGSLVLGFGLGITVQANIGADPVTVFITALANLYPILSVGNWSSVVCVVMIIIALVINRKYIGFTTVIYALLGQFTIDLAIMIVPLQESIVPGILILLLGFVVIAISVSIMSCGDMGYSAYDSMIFAISNKFKTTYKVIRYSSDAIFLVVGYLIGGLVGIGTILSLVCLGYMVDKAIKIFTPKLKKLIFTTKS